MVGWINPYFLSIVQYCDQLHHELSEKGGVVEIGVHHGKFFISLNLFCDADEPSLAIDVFGSQHLNIDKSGAGDLPTFQVNLREHCRHRGKNVAIMAADSTTLSPAAILSAIGMKPRFFSIDGGHTAEHTINDLNLARECLSPGGVIFVDDILNHHWLGVVEGVGKFLSQSPTIVPFAVGFNKLMLSRLSYHEFYLEDYVSISRAEGT